MADINVATWNVEWAKPGTVGGVRVLQVIDALDADVIVLTEGQKDLLPDGGHVIDAGADWGYEATLLRRKVLAWSRQPWTDIVRTDDGAGQGRLVIGATNTPIGTIDVVAVCIPWPDAHVRTGRRDASRWSEHLACCEQIRELPRRRPAVLAGDFNQRIPRSRQPLHVERALDAALERWTVWTRGDTSCGLLIDHIATTDELAVTDLRCWPGHDAGRRLSDHTGVSCRVEQQHRSA